MTKSPKRLSPQKRAAVIAKCSSKEEALSKLEKLEGKRLTWGGLSNDLTKASLPGAASLLKSGPGNTTWGKETRAQKTQEYNRLMGVTADLLGDVARQGSGGPEVAKYISTLAEEEQKYLNRRTARSASIGLARDMLFLRAFESRLKLFPTRITPKGYIAQHRKRGAVKRAVNTLWSDLHFGAHLNPKELPVGYGAHEEARRFARVVSEVRDYKPQYREQTHLNILVLGDIIEGLLQHDNTGDEDPLADQFASAVYNILQGVVCLAASFPTVSVYWQTGNHGRNKLVHPGRGTTSKWNSYETMIGLALKIPALLFGQLPNVTWHIDTRPYCVVPLFDHLLFATHGDTILNLGNPGNTLNVGNIEKQMNAINASGEYGPKPFSVFAAGHVHTGVHLSLPPGDLLINPALVPPNGFARGLNAHKERCGQWLWESVPGFPVGDCRLIKVGANDDANAELETIIKPMRFSYEVR